MGALAWGLHLIMRANLAWFGLWSHVVKTAITDQGVTLDQKWSRNWQGVVLISWSFFLVSVPHPSILLIFVGRPGRESPIMGMMRKALCSDVVWIIFTEYVFGILMLIWSCIVWPLSRPLPLPEFAHLDTSWLQEHNRLSTIGFGNSILWNNNILWNNVTS